MKTLTIRSIAPYQKVGFNWNDFFYNLSLSGLQNCAFFQNEIGTIKIINGVPTVTNTVDQTLMQSYNQYNKMGDLYINP